jgi:hypothetical protein
MLKDIDKYQYLDNSTLNKGDHKKEIIKEIKIKKALNKKKVKK